MDNIVYSDVSITIYRYVFEPVKTNMYVIIESEKAIIIDPHKSDFLEQNLRIFGVVDITVLLTHGHHDHTSGLPWLKERYNVKIICHRLCGIRIADEKNNRPLLVAFVLKNSDKELGPQKARKYLDEYRPYAYKPNIDFEEEYEYEWNKHSFLMKYTPGHSEDSVCIILDEKFIFTGDTLIKGQETITRFQGGDRKVLFERTLPYLKSLDEGLIVFPGHREKFRLSELE